MALTVTPESVSSITITPEGKAPTGSQITWDEATYTWDEATGTWDIPGLTIGLEEINSITITPEDKP